MFFILSFPLFLILSKEKTVNLFPIYCSSVIFIKLLVQQTIGIYCFVTLEKNNRGTVNRKKVYCFFFAQNKKGDSRKKYTPDNINSALQFLRNH